MELPKGICPKCGNVYLGWGLLRTGHGECKQCGTPLVIHLTPQQKRHLAKFKARNLN